MQETNPIPLMEYTLPMPLRCNRRAPVAGLHHCELEQGHTGTHQTHDGEATLTWTVKSKRSYGEQPK